MVPLLKRLHPRRLRRLTILPAILGFAQTPGAPIPDPAALLQEVQAHQSRVDELRENYTFHEITRTETLDGSGAGKTTTTEEHEVFFVNRRRILRLVKRDGVELTTREREKEQLRVKNEIEAATKGNGGYGRGRGGARAGLVREILAVAKTSSPRRVVLRGRPSLVFDFAGDPKATAQTREQSVAKKVTGTVWIDEADKQVARLEVRFYDNFRIAGGLVASVQKGTSVEIDQSPLGEGLWMQTGSEQHLAARLLIKSYHQNVHVEDFDFRKFDIGTAQKIGSPALKN